MQIFKFTTKHLARTSMSNFTLTFENLISPLNTQEFLDAYWEKKFCYLRQWQGRSFDNVFSLRDVDRWLMSTRNDLADSVIITSPEGAERQMQKYRPQDINLEAVYEAFSKGHSVVLNRLEYSWPPIISAAKSLGEEFCADIGINVYLTPRGSKTFPIHVDDHDVFILQVNGEKLWRLHELNNLSVMRLEYKKELLLTPEWGPERLQTPLLEELTLRPGDVLYIPRGMPHCAVARDSTSLHLTVSITPLYWTDFLKAAVEQASVHAPELRLALPLGFVGRPGIGEKLRYDFARALTAFHEHVSFEDTLEVVRRNRIRAQGYPFDGQLGHINQLHNLSLDSVVEKRPDILCSVDCSKPNSSSILFSTRNVRGPRRAIEALEFIRDNSRFRVSELPNLDDQSKLALVKTLICEGLLRFAQAS